MRHPPTILVFSTGTATTDLGVGAERPDLIVAPVAELSAARLAGIAAREVA